MTTPAEILAQLRADMQGAKERGVCIVKGCFGNGVTRCCALTAHGPYEGCPCIAAANRLGITEREAIAIYEGFDNPWFKRIAGEEHPAYHAIGATLRAEFPPEG